MRKVMSSATSFRGIAWFRNVNQPYANRRNILSAKGSYLYGGRFNVARDFGVLYLSCDLHTSIAELEHSAKYGGRTVEETLPRTIIGMKVTTGRVLDLTDDVVRRKLKISQRVLLNTDWAKENRKGNDAATQIIGRAARTAGFKALLVPSARWKGKNLNLFDDGNLAARAKPVRPRFLAP